MKGIEDFLYPLKSYYAKSPLFLQYVLGSLYRTIPLKQRFGNTYLHFKALLSDPNHWTSEFVRRYQNEQFLKTIEVAKKTKFYPSFYRDHGVDIGTIKSLDDIERLPFIEKAHVQSHGEDMVNPNQASNSLYLTTGGTTGVPTSYYYERGVTRPKELAFIENIWSQVGYRSGDRCAVIRGTVVDAKSDASKIHQYDAIRNWLILSSYHLTENTFEKYIQLINQFKPKFIQGFPSALAIIAKAMIRNKVKLKVPIKAVFSASENIFPHQKKVIEEAFSARVITWYGHTEVVVLGGYCKFQDLYHIFPHYGYTELVRDGQVIKQGQGEIVGTGFHNSVMPLIRYKTKDYAVLSDTGRCQCGRNDLLFDKILGRDYEYIITKKGRKISLSAMNMHDDFYENMKQFQFEQFKPEEVVFKYALLDKARGVEQAKVAKSLKAKLGDDIGVVLQEVERIPPTARGKLHTLVQHIEAEVEI